jgi:hypothetical protein
MAVSSTGKQTAYVAKESTFGTAVTPVGADALQFTSLSTDAIQGTVDRTDKTGTADAAISILDNGSASFSMGYEMSGSGTAGTVADDHVLMENLFGSTTVTGGTSVLYTPADVEGSFTMMNLDKPTVNDQEIIIGGIVQSATFRIGPAIPFIDLTGAAKWCIRKSQFASLTAEQKGGLGSFPAEPGTPAITGFPPRGRTGSITIDGNVYGNFLDATINFNTGVSLGPFQFGSSSPSGPRRLRRVVTADMSIEDDGSANWNALSLKIPTNTPITITIVIGTIAGNIHTFTLNNAVLPQPTFDRSGSSRVLRFSGIKMAPTSASAANPLVYLRT